MKKFLLTISMFLGAGVSMMQAQTFEDAYSAVENMRIGWNLGNTLDANSGDKTNMWIEAWTDRLPTNYETSWAQPATTRELIHMFKEAGFNTIRVPVTWYPHIGTVTVNVGPNASGDWVGTWDMDTWTGYKVDPAWMARVHEIVDYVIDEGMYCVLNVHHDTGAANTAWLRADPVVFEQQKERFASLWTEIATEFADYGERLIFEGYNEMLDSYGSWCFASFAAPGNYNATSAKGSYEAINNYAQTFVNAVRATGGNNLERNLVVNTYGACCGEGDWNSHLTDPLTNMAKPEDVTDGHIIFSVHCYPDVKNVANAKSAVNKVISRVRTNLMEKGCPVIIGEWGTSSNNDFAQYNANLNEFARYFVETTKANKIGTIYWMQLSEGGDRSVPKWSLPDLKEAIVKGWYGEEGYNGIADAMESDDLDAPVYDLIGRKVANPIAPGVYIKAGKKYLVK